MSVPKIILELVERFERHREAYQSGHYNETQVRREFIDPFFKALGWDIDNEQGNAEAYKDVIHEDAIKIGSATKAPDYCFRIGGTRKYFLEAKKPSIDVKGDPGPAYQLRRYAWSAKLPLSVLTDFEELAVYDCRVRPVPTDKSSTARIKYYTYTDYAEKWDEIASIFSKEAVLKGSFDKYAESARGKKGTAQVDDTFLAEIESWRDELAHNIALRNPKLDGRQLNFAVQMTIDRLIFLRICEDRGVERYGELMGLMNGDSIYQRLLVLFRKADDRYNSGLFHFSKEKDRPDSPDELTPNLTIDDKVLKDIFKRLYYPDSPYEFSVLPAEILGQVYEQFLGKVITLTTGHRAKVEDKPEVKKAGGVFYTPAYIVDYIVQNTVGKLVEGKTPKEVEKIKILDPACGSGSFLLGAYQFLLDWHLKWYLEHSPEDWAKGKRPAVCVSASTRTEEEKGGQGGHGGLSGRSGQKTQPGAAVLQAYKLTLDERKKILLNNIFGVDIDTQAVEVTKLSLLLKVLEGQKDLSLFARERALPDLGQNIKCGNSLIGPDFYHNQQGLMFDDDEQRYKINAFDWQAEFEDIFSRKNPGFDAVIGNPPYGAFLSKEEENYLSLKHPLFDTIKDIFIAFIQFGHNCLSKNGYFGFIVPSAWLGGPRFISLRKYLLGHSIQTIIQLPFDVFKDAYVDTLIFTTQNTPPQKTHDVLTYEYPKKEKLFTIDLSKLELNRITQNTWNDLEDVKFVLNVSFHRLIGRLFKSFKDRIASAYEMKRGVLFDSKLLTPSKTNGNSYRYFEGDVYRYKIDIKTPSWVEFGDKMKECPKETKWFSEERLLLRRLVNRQKRLMAVIATESFITNKNLYSILSVGKYSLQYLLGILNSKLFSKMYLSMVSQSTKDDFPQVTLKDVLNLPIPSLDLSQKKDKSLHDKMVSLVEGMLDLHKKLSAAKTPNETTVLQRQIDSTDDQIDRLVYELYGLTEEEIQIIEGAGK